MFDIIYQSISATLPTTWRCCPKVFKSFLDSRVAKFCWQQAPNSPHHEYIHKTGRGYNFYYWNFITRVHYENILNLYISLSTVTILIKLLISVINSIRYETLMIDVQINVFNLNVTGITFHRQILLHIYKFKCI